MFETNPYAAPQAQLDHPSGEGCWREGDTLVMHRDTVLPHRCIKCNAPVDEPARMKTLYWHHPAIYLLVLLNIIIYIIVAMAVRKQAEVNLGLCTQHRKRRTLGMWIGISGPILSLVVLFVGLGSEIPALAVLGGLAILPTIIAGIVLARLATPIRIDREFVRLKGFGGAYLDSLPTHFV